MTKSKVVAFFTLVLSSFSSNVYSQMIEFDKESVLEAQYKNLSNSDQAKDAGQDWDSEQLGSVYSNMDFNLKIFEHKFKATWFLRHGSSELFADDRLGLNYHFFPRKVIARDLIKMQYTHETRTTRTESILNRFTYEFGDEEFKFKIGRMYIDWGDGYIANPINPFNLPGFNGGVAKFNQGNDGLEATIQTDDRLRLKIYALQDRSFRDYQDERVTRTFFLHGWWQYKPDTEIQYILGEDNKRHKYGLQVKKSFEKGMAYFQAVRFSQRLDKQEAGEKGLSHFIVGTEYMFIPKLTTRIEFGKQEFAPELNEANHLSTTFIPLKRIMAIANSYQFNDQHSANLVYGLDGNSKFSFLNLDYTFEPRENHELFSRVLAPLSETEADESLGTLQQALATEVTLGYRFFY